MRTHYIQIAIDLLVLRNVENILLSCKRQELYFMRHVTAFVRYQLLCCFDEFFYQINYDGNTQIKSFSFSIRLLIVIENTQSTHKYTIHWDRKCYGACAFDPPQRRIHRLEHVVNVFIIHAPLLIK